MKRIIHSILRYVVLEAHGMQWSITDEHYSHLNNVIKIDGELYGSPFNTYTGNYASLFPDVDMYFGGGKSFLEFEIEDGKTYTSNPPYIDEIMTRTMSLLAQAVQTPLPNTKFFMTIVIWEDSTTWELLEKLEKQGVIHNKTIGQLEYVDKWQNRTCTIRNRTCQFLISKKA